MHTYRAASPGTNAAGDAGDAPNLALDRARKSISPPEGLRGTGVGRGDLLDKAGTVRFAGTAGVNVSVGVVLNAWTNV